MSAGDDRIVYGMVKRGRCGDPGKNWQGAAAGALTYAREVDPDAETSTAFWIAQAVVFALHDVADAIRANDPAAVPEETL
jgi:hypothetical protein